MFNLWTWKYRKVRTPPDGLRGLGAWLQPNSVNHGLAYQHCDWLAVHFSVLDIALEMTGTKPVFAAIGKQYINYKTCTQMWRKPIIGVLLDYEGGKTEKEAVRELSPIYQNLRSRGLWVGISTLAGPNNSKIQNGVNFANAKQYCDFLVPQVYAQIWNCDRETTMKRYLSELAVTSVPIIPLMAYRTTQQDDNNISNEQIVSNYKQLALKSFAVWNCNGATEDFWKIVKKLV
jgi:hypothetical protein